MTKDDVVFAYRVLLGRNPESDDVIQEKIDSCDSLHALRGAIMRSQEFRMSNPEFSLACGSLIVLKEFEDFRLFLDLGDLFCLSIARGTHEPDALRFVRSVVSSGDVALDIGTHVGLFTITMAKTVGPAGRVIAFEPLSDNAELLKRSIVENELGDVIELHEAAAGAETGTAQLVRPSGERALAHLDPALQRRDDLATELLSVEVETLDGLNLARPPKFIKIDVEGAEPLVFEGAKRLLKEHRPLILSEVNGPQLAHVSGSSATDLVAMLEGLGYGAREVTPSGPGAPVTHVDDASVTDLAFVPR